ncbi:MAG: hypothetical protein LV480_04865, partial [Methylacidiphilales bacterium]|nr:hypothetical protein [Candidatus Methylacidiphilales bacterium]
MTDTEFDAHCEEAIDELETKQNGRPKAQSAQKVSNLRQSRRLGVVNRSKRFDPLVPKLYLGTHLSAKLCFSPRPKQRS